MDKIIVSLGLLFLALKLAQAVFPFTGQIPLIFKNLLVFCWKKRPVKLTGAKKSQPKIFYHRKHKP
jgi:hypothetical protein